MNLTRRHLVASSVIFRESQHVMHAQNGTFYSTVAARVYTMVMLCKCCFFVSIIFRNIVIVWHFGLLLLSGPIWDP